MLMFKRIRNMWNLSRKDQKALEVLESLTPEQLAEVPDSVETVRGDGKATFFGEGTEEEFIEEERKNEGMSGWYNRIKEL